MFDRTKYLQERYRNDSKFREYFKKLVLKSEKKRRGIYRKKLQEHLGNICSKCGFSNTEILEFHHINNNGKKDRLSVTRLKYYSEHLEEAKISLIVLCPNCHSIETNPFLDMDGIVQKTRQRLFGILGRFICERCEFSDFRALQFDHIKGHGFEEKKKFKGGTKMLKYYNARPDLAKIHFTVLCSNCNRIKQRENNEFRS